MDEPESLGALWVAGRERLDNLTFVVNCNLQRLDGPVRGNGKIIQELEGIFRGAGWNVIKVIWGREWDELLARDIDGVLVNRMNETVDGEFQKYSVAGGAYIREHFFGPDPRLRKLVEHLSDDDLTTSPPRRPRLPQALRRVQGRHRAPRRAHRDPGQDDQGLDPRPGRRGPQHHPPGEEALRGRAADLPRSPGAADPRREAHGGALLPSRSRFRGGPVPPGAAPRARRLAAEADRAPATAAGAGGRGPTPSSRRAPRRPSARRWSSPSCSATSCATRASGPASCRSSPTRHAPSAWTPSSRRSGSTPRVGQRYEPVDSDLVLSYREAKDGQVLEEGITEAGSMASFQAAGDVVRHARRADDPLLHLLLDVRLPADRRPGLGLRRRPGPWLHDGRDGRPDHAQRRGPPARGRPQPPPGLDDPAAAGLRPGVRLRAGDDRPRRHRADARARRGPPLLRHAVQREPPDAAEARRDR